MNIKYHNANGLIETLGDIRHYNHNHDALGRFARSGSSGLSNRAKRKIDKDIETSIGNPKRKSKMNRNKQERSKLRNKIIDESLDTDTESIRRNLDRWHDKTKPYYDKIDTIRKDVESRRDREIQKEIDKAISKNGSEYLMEYVQEINDRTYSKYNDEFDKKTQSYRKQIQKISDERKKEEAEKFYNAGQKYTEQYIDATIKDLRLKNNQETRDYIKSKYDDTWFMEGADTYYKDYLRRK